MSSGNSSESRLAYLDGLRGLAAFAVTLAHTVVAFDYALYSGDEKYAHGNWESAIAGSPLALVYAGNFSVCIFLVMSGIVLFRSFHNQGATLGAALRRYLRLAIPVTVVCLFSLGLKITGAYHNVEAAKLTKATEWLGGQMQYSPHLQNAISEGAYRTFMHPLPFEQSHDSSLWTMRIEFQGSALILLIALIVRLVPAKATKVCLLLVTVIAGLLCWSYYLVLFPIGIILGWSLDQKWSVPRRLKPLGLAIFLGLGLLLGSVPYGKTVWPVYGFFLEYSPRLATSHLSTPFDPHSFWHGLGAVFLVGGVMHATRLQRFLAKPLFQFLGRISFPLYLVHVPVLLSLGCGTLLFTYSMSHSYLSAALVATVVYLGASLLLAQISYRLVELPAVNLSRSIGKKIDHWGHQLLPASKSRS